jgi:hypothetical protein
MFPRLATLAAAAALLARSGAAQGNPCPMDAPDHSAPQRSCGNSLCFAGIFTDNAVLQRAPEAAAYYGATGSPPVPGAAVSLNIAGVLDSGAAYNKTFSTTSMQDGTWKVLLDPMPTFGLFTTRISCAACAGGQSAQIINQTFGDGK